MPKPKQKSKPALSERVLAELTSATVPLTPSQIAKNLGLRKDTAVRSQLRKLAESAIARGEDHQGDMVWSLAGRESPSSGAPASHVDTALTERLVEAMAANQHPWKSRDLATQLKLDPAVIRKELIELEGLGLVYRTGQTRGTRWHLG